MADKLIGADVLTRAIVNSPSDTSGYNPVYCQGVAKRQIEILDIILNMNGTTEAEIRAKAIAEFAERLNSKISDFVLDHKDNLDFASGVSVAWAMVDEIAEEMKKGR